MRRPTRRQGVAVFPVDGIEIMIITQQRNSFAEADHIRKDRPKCPGGVCQDTRVTFDERVLIEAA